MTSGPLQLCDSRSPFINGGTFWNMRSSKHGAHDSKATPVEVWEEPNSRSGGLPSMEPLSRDLPACPASPTWREASWGRVMTQTPAFPLPMALEPFRPQSTRAPSYHSRGQRSALASWPWREGGEEGREP